LNVKVFCFPFSDLPTLSVALLSLLDWLADFLDGAEEEEEEDEGRGGLVDVLEGFEGCCWLLEVSWVLLLLLLLLGLGMLVEEEVVVVVVVVLLLLFLF
jgi:hypothetical protein